MKKTILLLLLSMLLLPVGHAGAQKQKVVITPQNSERAKKILEQMTLEEKIDYIGGYNGFSIRAIPRLGLPEIKMSDGPQGLRNDTKSTLYPCGILSAATWNRDLLYQLGEGLGSDARARGVGFLLGPGVNIYRSPLCGRNFEYFGEDPYLASEAAKEYVLGVQSRGVIATIKHFAANNQEWNRYDVSSDVDERTMQEIYLATFRKAVTEAGVGAIMNSYNLLNSVHATESRWLNIEVLRHQWGFRGILMSDWGSVHSAMGAATGGLDLEMPAGDYMNKKNLMPAIQNGTLPLSVIDEKVQHILQTLIAFGMLDRPQKDESIPLDNPITRQTAYRLAYEGMVLLKNEGGVLPLKGSVAVMGPNAQRIPTGGGSGFVTPYSSVSPWEGISQLLGKRATLIGNDIWCTQEEGRLFTNEGLSTQGLTAQYFNNTKFEGAPVLTREEKQIDYNWGTQAPAPGVNKDGFSVRWTAVYSPSKSGLLKLTMSGDDGYRIFVNDQKVVSDWGNHGVTTKEGYIQVEAGKNYQLRIEYFDNGQDASAVVQTSIVDKSKLKSALDKCKNVVLCFGFDSSLEGEGWDRTFALPDWQNEMIKEIASWHKNIVLVLNAGGGIDFTPWIGDVQALLMAWYPGEEGGSALAQILSGRISPSGKLPATFDERWEDNPTYSNYNDNVGDTYKRVQYNEGLFMGYRGYDATGKKPLFPFGFGLSYTTFAYSNLTVNKTGDNEVSVGFDIKNTGSYNGSEIAQLYLHAQKPVIATPYKQLKGFDKVYLKKGETRHVTLTLGADAFSYYDAATAKFVVSPGDYEILVGGSSDNLPLKGSVTF